ncbi:MAG: GNAT family N-acetyltransferase [Ilumatobacteraceae bacterium]
MRAERHAGPGALEALSALLRRSRLAHSTWGAWEAADVHWWWRLDRRVDPDDCLVWSDESGPTAAVFATRFRDDLLADVVRLPDAPVLPEIVAAAAALTEHHPGASWACVDGDEALATALGSIGAVPTEEAMSAMWMATDAASASAIADGYRIERRSDQPVGSPHHLARRNGDDVADRLAESSIYRRDLDLLVRAPDGSVAGYALFWADPVTGVGLVEPVRVEDEHSGRGIARALVAAGVRALAEAGCRRAKVSSMVDNPAAIAAYRAVGFVPTATIRTWR